MHQRNLTSGVHGEFAKRRKSRVEYVCDGELSVIGAVVAVNDGPQTRYQLNCVFSDGAIEPLNEPLNERLVRLVATHPGTQLAYLASVVSQSRAGGDLLLGVDGKGGKTAAKKRSEKSGQKKVVRKSGQKTVDRLLELLRKHPHLTQAVMVNALMVTRSTVQKHLSNLKSAGKLRRVGPDKGGHWEVIG